MSGIAEHKRSKFLRSDLKTIVVEGVSRTYRIVIDEVSGRYARIAEHDWQALNRDVADEQTLAEARAVGWTRERTSIPKRTFHPLAIRVPIGSIDWLAKPLAIVSGCVFSVYAIALWTMAIVLAAGTIASRHEEFFGSFASLQQFLQQSNPWWMLGLFAATKACHELGHAIACRRMGSRCGEIGVLFLCGMPCPYCDVSEIWKQPSATKRAAVMLAGIYVELIIATIAVLLWCVSSDPETRLTALNLIVLCGISTVVFNANPLMRYDGYFVLSDILGSTNLRQESQLAFRQFIVRRIAGCGYRAQSASTMRAALLSAFHLCTLAYRLVVLAAIAAMIFAVAGNIHVCSIVMIAAALFSIAMVMRLAKRAISLLRGDDRWRDVPVARRVLITGLGTAALLAMLLVPIPRYRSVSARTDAIESVSVFIPQDGIVRAVGADFGSHVSAGNVLVVVDDQNLATETVKLSGRLKVAQMRSNLSRQRSLDAPRAAEQWNALNAVEDALQHQLVSLQRRQDKQTVRAPAAGVVIPAASQIQFNRSRTDAHRDYFSLNMKQGQLASTREPWCRISDGRVGAVMEIDAQDQQEILDGTPAKISAARWGGQVIESRVRSVSAIQRDRNSPIEQAKYRVVCPVGKSDDVCNMIGQECKVVFRLQPRSIIETVYRSVRSLWFESI